MGECGAVAVHCDERGIQRRAPTVDGEHEMHAVAAPGHIRLQPGRMRLQAWLHGVAASATSEWL